MLRDYSKLIKITPKEKGISYLLFYEDGNWIKVGQTIIDMSLNQIQLRFSVDDSSRENIFSIRQESLELQDYQYRWYITGGRNISVSNLKIWVKERVTEKKYLVSDRNIKFLEVKKSQNGMYHFQNFDGLIEFFVIKEIEEVYIKCDIIYHISYNEVIEVADIRLKNTIAQLNRDLIERDGIIRKIEQEKLEQRKTIEQLEQGILENKKKFGELSSQKQKVGEENQKLIKQIYLSIKEMENMIQEIKQLKQSTVELIQQLEEIKVKNDVLRNQVQQGENELEWIKRNPEKLMIKKLKDLLITYKKSKDNE